MTTREARIELEAEDFVERTRRCDHSRNDPTTVQGTPRAERADYFDAGLVQKLGPDFEIGLDSFYKSSRNLIGT